MAAAISTSDAGDGDAGGNREAADCRRARDSAAGTREEQSHLGLDLDSSLFHHGHGTLRAGLDRAPPDSSRHGEDSCEAVEGIRSALEKRKQANYY